MAASVQLRPQNRDLGMVMREVDEDLAIFLGMRNSEKENNGHFLAEESGEFNDSKGVEPRADSLMNLNASQAEIGLADGKLLDLEIEKSDYNWLLTQPDSSSSPSLKGEVEDSTTNQTETSNGQVAISLNSEVENSCKESVSMNANSSISADSSAAASNRRPLSSENRKPTAKAPKSKPSRACTPTARPMLTSKSMAAQGRSSTTSGVSTPASRPSVPVLSKSASRSSTPTRKSATPLTMLTKSAPSRGTSPSVRSRQSKPSKTLSSSHDADQDPRISMPKRAASASRTRSSSCNGTLRQKSCSPTKVRAPISTGNKTGNKILTRSRGYGNDGDDVNPVIMGTKMVHRVVSMRKLAPPKQDECVSHDNQRKSSQENSGFGRSLSKKSLDMALRHMDIRLSIPDKLRPITTGVSSSAKSKTNSVSESPPTSSSDSSKSSKSVI